MASEDTTVGPQPLTKAEHDLIAEEAKQQGDVDRLLSRHGPKGTISRTLAKRDRKNIMRRLNQLTEFYGNRKRAEEQQNGGKEEPEEWIKDGWSALSSRQGAGLPFNSEQRFMNWHRLPPHLLPPPVPATQSNSSNIISKPNTKTTADSLETPTSPPPATNSPSDTDAETGNREHGRDQTSEPKSSGTTQSPRPTSLLAIKSPLPAGWSEYHTTDGTPYYYSSADGQTSWGRPVSSAAAAAEGVEPVVNATTPLPAGWSEHQTTDGRTYYYSSTGKQTTWKRPVANAMNPVTNHSTPTSIDNANQVPIGGIAQPQNSVISTPARRGPPAPARRGASTAARRGASTTARRGTSASNTVAPLIGNPAPLVNPAAVTSASSTQPLADVWYEAADPSNGSPYWYNNEGQAVREKPTAPATIPPTPVVAPPPTGKLPAGWWDAKSPDGTVYYYTAGGEQQWERPTAPAQDLRSNGSARTVANPARRNGARVLGGSHEGRSKWLDELERGGGG